jgi:hypothetical protein
MHNMLADVSLRPMSTTSMTAVIAIVYITALESLLESLLLYLGSKNDTLRRSYCGPVQAIASMVWRRSFRYNKDKTERCRQ